jgi:hypothetical protein
MAFSSTTPVLSGFARTTRAALSLNNLMSTQLLRTQLVRAQPVLVAGLVLLQRHASRRTDVYNILWAVVFGFATLNILSLAARRFEPNRRGLTFGELMAVLVVLISIFLLGWELLGVFRIFPIQLHR